MRTLCVVFAVVATSACQCQKTEVSDGGPGGGGGGGDGGNPVAECNGFANDYCTWLGRCFGLPNPAECRAAIEGYCTVTLSSVARGFSVYNAGGFEACKQAFSATAACDVPSATCQPFGPNVFDGGQCNIANDCVLSGPNNLYVPTVCGASAGCPSRCEPGGLLGMPCIFSSCAPGLRCDTLTNTCSAPLPLDAGCSPSQYPPVCGLQAYCDRQTSRCAALPGTGESCPELLCMPGLTCSGFASGTCVPLRVQGETCAFRPECIATLTCINGMCQPRVQSGGACSETSECVEGLNCSLGLCSAPKPYGAPCDGVSGLECQNGICDRVLGVCIDWTTMRGAGAPCGDQPICDAGVCLGLASGLDGGAARGQCGAPVAGSPCFTDIVVPQCPSTQTCLTVDAGMFSGPGRCQDIVAGGRCGRTGDCLATERCEAGFRRCVARRIEGEQCFFDDCAAGLDCVQGRCAQRRGPGQSCDAGPCMNGLECLDGTCLFTGFPGAQCRRCDAFFGCDVTSCALGVCDTDAGFCVRPRTTGPCNDDYECESQRCRAHQCVATCN